MRALVKSESKSHNDEVVEAIRIISQTITALFRHEQAVQSPFTGMLLAEFETHFQPAVLNEVVKYINDRGLDVWLEMAPPTYLSERQLRDISMASIKGLVARNGTIRPDGDRQNYFQMTELRTAMRTIAAQRVRHGPPIMMWETVDDGVQLNHAVIQRTFNWCRYNSMLCWIGPAAALTEAEIAAAKTVTEKPLGALMWLKNDNNMKAHDVWRSNSQVYIPLSHLSMLPELTYFLI